MTDKLPDDTRTAFDRHDAFEASGESTFDVSTTPFETEVTAVPPEADGRDAQIIVRVWLPTLDAATKEAVGETVADGWFETLGLRLEDAYDAPEADPVETPTFDRDDDVIEATFRFRAWTADSGVDNAKALVDFVEGTYVQGVIPGYTYEDPVRSLLARAREHGGDEGTDGAAHGGTPL